MHRQPRTLKAIAFHSSQPGSLQGYSDTVSQGGMQVNKMGVDWEFCVTRLELFMSEVSVIFRLL